MAELMERRQTQRTPFWSDCALEVFAPPEDAILGVLHGQTVNLTEHGLRVAVPGVGRDIVDRWQEEMTHDRAVEVRVNLTEFPDSPPLQGQIAWTDWSLTDLHGPTCHLGLLFRILSNRESEALRGILDDVTSRGAV